MNIEEAEKALPRLASSEFTKERWAFKDGMIVVENWKPVGWIPKREISIPVSYERVIMFEDPDGQKKWHEVPKSVFIFTVEKAMVSKK